jgi:hypothetical protein
MSQTIDLDNRLCAGGCGRILPRRPHERPSRYRRFCSQTCINKARPLWGPRTSKRNQTIIDLAERGIVQVEISRRLWLSYGVVAGVLHRAREMGLLADLNEITDTTTRNPFPAYGHCVWPSQHPVSDPAFHFCGEPVCNLGESWCAEHRKKVYCKRSKDGFVEDIVSQSGPNSGNSRRSWSFRYGE